MSDLLNTLSFFTTWKEVCESQVDLLFKNWSNPRTYSSIILDMDNSVLDQISKKLCINYYREYYSLDAVFYDESDLVPDRPENTTWLRRIRIAFEHENNIDGIYQEISHLLITNCDLRVLVTYPNVDEKVHLKYIQDLMIGSNSSSSIPILVIFGWKEENNYILWEGYEFKQTGWILLR